MIKIKNKFSRTIIGVGCIVVGLIICFVIAPIVNNLSAAKIEVVRLVKNVSQGSVISNDDVELIEVGSYNLPDEAIKDISQVVGQYAACDLKAKDYLFPSKLSTTANSAEDIFKSLGDDQRAISFSIKTFASGLSGKLKNGDIISIIVKSENDTLIPPELKYLRVITATTKSGNDADQIDTSDKDTQLSTVTVLVNDMQAETLIRYETSGALHISLVCRGDIEKANNLLKEQDNVLQELKELAESEVSGENSNNDVSDEVSQDE